MSYIYSVWLHLDHGQPVLDRDVFELVILDLRRGLDFDETPATIPAPMQDVYFHEYVLVLKHTVEDRWYFAIRDQLPRGADRFIQSVVATNLDPTRKQLPGEHANLMSLPNDRLARSIRLTPEFWPVNLPVEPQALAPRYESAL